jgi:signal transduction histidine kinase/DNA-binding NarL/FixJ family response regulator
MDIFDQIVRVNQSILITVAEIAVFTVLLSLILYHFVIYLGRRNFPGGKLYLDVSLFLSGLLFYIFLDTNMYYIVFSLVADTARWTTLLTSISWAIILGSLVKMLNGSVGSPERVRKITRTAWYLYAGLMALWITPFIPWLTVYHGQIFITFWVINGLFIGFYSVIYFKLVSSVAARLEPGIKIIAITSLAYIIYVWFYRIAIIIYPVHLLLPFWLINNFLKIGIAFTFAFSLAIRFNLEFTDLIALKEDLQKKVTEKTAELQIAMKKAETANKIKTDYFIGIAHETKTPLTLIGNYLDRYIKVNKPSDDLAIIKDNFSLLNEAMIRFLDAEKFERNKLVYDHDQVSDLSELVKIKIPLYRELARLKNRNFTATADDNIFVRADRLALERIINNLFDNALKFTSEFDSIDLTLIRVNSHAHIKVSDTGPGIEKESVAKIFEPYFQGSSPEKNPAGLGMGLSIVKQITDSLGGEIKVDTSPGQGTVFTILLPIADEAVTLPSGEKISSLSGNSPAKNEAAPSYDPERKNILIVEDNREMLDYLKDELSQLYNVFSAANGLDALDVLKHSPPQDIITSDVMMDTMNGFEFFELVSKDSRFESIPFVFITARSDDGEKITMLNRGAVDYIYKPFTIDELKGKISSLLKFAEAGRKAVISEAINELNMKLAGKSAGQRADKWEIFAGRIKDYQLTGRQIEIMREVEKGLEYKEIANNLNISLKTVHRHMQILFEKFNVHSKIELLKVLFE